MRQSGLASEPTGRRARAAGLAVIQPIGARTATDLAAARAVITPDEVNGAEISDGRAVPRRCPPAAIDNDLSRAQRMRASRREARPLVCPLMCPKRLS
jgi:hypothetical protein